MAVGLMEADLQLFFSSCTVADARDGSARHDDARIGQKRRMRVMRDHQHELARIEE